MNYTASPIVQNIAVNVFGSGTIDGPTFINHCSPGKWEGKWDEIFVARGVLKDLLRWQGEELRSEHIPGHEQIQQDIYFLGWLLETVMALGGAARQRQDAQTWNTKKRTAA